jgi:hypothetical protein
MIRLTVFILLFSTNTLSQELELNLGKDLSIDSTRTNFVLEGIKSEIAFQKLDIHNTKYIFELLQETNRNTLYLNKNELVQFLYTEIFKVSLSSGLIKNTKTQISTALISSAKQKLKKSSIKYSPLGKYFIKEFLRDFTYYVQDGSLKKFYMNKELSSIKRERIRKLLQYSSRWITSFEKLTPDQFNFLIRRHTFNYLQNLAEKSKIFFNQSKTRSTKYNVLFQFENLQRYQNSLNSKDIQKDESSNKLTPTDIIKNLNVELHDTATKKIDELIENIEEKP